MQNRFNAALIAVHQNVRNYLSSLRGRKLRQFRALYRRFADDLRLWSSGGKDSKEVPEGFGKFYPKKSGQSSSSKADGKQESSESRGKQVEFRMNFRFPLSKSGGGGGGGGGPGGGSAGPLDPNMWALVGFFGTIAALAYLSLNTLR